jgi:hypothetical protein
MRYLGAGQLLHDRQENLPIAQQGKERLIRLPGCSCLNTKQSPDRFDGHATNDFNVVQEAAAILYRVGALGLKLESQDRVFYSHLDQPLIAPTVLSRSSRARLHPMLHAAFNMQERAVK